MQQQPRVTRRRAYSEGDVRVTTVAVGLLEVAPRGVQPCVLVCLGSVHRPVQ